MIEGFQTQVVYLDFLPGVVDYSSQSTRDAIQAGIGAIYSAFNFTFTQTQPTSGPYETLYFNVPAGSLLAGEATELDWRNLDLGGSASIDISQFLGGPDQPADTLTNIINMSATIGAHELGHLSGLIHGDSFGPIGAGIYANLADNPYLDGFNPPYPGPANAVGTQYDVIASPASVGTSLFDAANVTFFGERDDIATGVRRLGHGDERDGRRPQYLGRDGPAPDSRTAVRPEHAADRPGHRRYLQRHRRRCRRLDRARRRWPEQRRLLCHHRDGGRAAQLPGPVAVFDSRRRKRDRFGADDLRSRRQHGGPVQRQPRGCVQRRWLPGCRRRPLRPHDAVHGHLLREGEHLRRHRLVRHRS